MNGQGQASPRRRQLNVRVRDGNSFYKFFSSLKVKKVDGYQQTVLAGSKRDVFQM